ncbi:hypothetical protein ZIOFF_011637 [Zingiber officinale]|uniref:Uncharacterized protein n=1 Tax=Zingiber officinale TaxID=94328 RepID=A0A8J5HNF2_ZINOF|nr:hypothetical protein ZIOFF_011637 [Zingiber officinale]
MLSMTCCMELVAAVLVGTQKKIVTAENSVWDEYIKTHGDVEQFRYKSLAYYEELSIIFGGDRSSGKDAQVPADIVEELDKVAVENDESIGVDGDYASYVQDFIFESSEENSKPKRRKTESTKDLSRVIREAIAILGEELNNASDFQAASLTVVFEGTTLSMEEVCSLHLPPPWKVQGSALYYGLGMISGYFLCDLMTILPGHAVPDFEKVVQDHVYDYDILQGEREDAAFDAIASSLGAPLQGS